MNREAAKFGSQENGINGFALGLEVGKGLERHQIDATDDDVKEVTDIAIEIVRRGRREISVETIGGEVLELFSIREGRQKTDFYPGSRLKRQVEQREERIRPSLLRAAAEESRRKRRDKKTERRKVRENKYG